MDDVVADEDSFLAAMEVVPSMAPDEVEDYIGDMLLHCTTMIVPAKTKDGVEGNLFTEVLFMPVIGSPRDIYKLTQGADALQRIAGTFQRHDMIPKSTGSAAAYPFLLDPSELIELAVSDLPALRKSCLALMNNLLGNGMEAEVPSREAYGVFHEMDEGIRDAMRDSQHDKSETVVGARLMPIAVSVFVPKPGEHLLGVGLVTDSSKMDAWNHEIVGRTPCWANLPSPLVDASETAILGVCCSMVSSARNGNPGLSGGCFVQRDPQNDRLCIVALADGSVAAKFHVLLPTLYGGGNFIDELSE